MGTRAANKIEGTSETELVPLTCIDLADMQIPTVEGNYYFSEK